MKKRIFALLLALALLLVVLPASAQRGSVPLYDVYPASGDGNAWIEVPNEYEFFTVPMGFTYAVVADPSMTMDRIAAFVHIPAGFERLAGAADLAGFAEDGRRVLGGMDETEASTVIERYTISDLPAVRVNMTGQGYEMIWIGDGEDIYFFMYPLANAAFADMVRDMADSFHLDRAKTPSSSDPADFAYTADENGVTVTAYTGSHSRVAIPEQIDGLPVIALADKAFYEADVTWVEIPDSVRGIGSYCFSGCALLQTVRLPQTLKEIPDGLFESCMRLRAVEIPEGVETIGYSAFWHNYSLCDVVLPASLANIGGLNFAGCLSLERIGVAEGNTAFVTLDDGAVLLTADGKEFIFYAALQDREVYTVPEGVEIIRPFAFGMQAGLRSVIVPEGVTEIGGGAFIVVIGLEQLQVPASAVSMGSVQTHIDAGVVMPKPDEEARDYVIAVTGYATIVAPEGSAAQAHAAQFKLTFEAAEAADEVDRE